MPIAFPLLQTEMNYSPFESFDFDKLDARIGWLVGW